MNDYNHNWLNQVNKTKILRLQRAEALIDAAWYWGQLGVSTVPAMPKSKKCLLVGWRQYESKAPTPQLYSRWFAAGEMNIAVVCSSGGLLVLDFDDLALYNDWLALAGNLAFTYAETTGRGIHLFYQVETPKTFRFSHGEALGAGHLCLIAPSIHPEGLLYTPMGQYPVLRVKDSEIYSLLSENPRQASPQAKQLGKAKRAIGPYNRSLVDRIKAVLPLMDLAGQYTQLRPSGGNGRYFVGRCPLHDDKEPSFWVDAEKELWGCFALTCPGHKGGDVINLFARLENITDSEAIKRLAKRVP